MNAPASNRIQSLDLLKGLVMVFMALDHTRDYFHAPAMLYDPTDPTHTSIPIFFTRWITHYCAPTFSFLAGVSAFLVSRKKTTAELSGFLFKRGLWLVFIELTIVNFAWYFDVQFRNDGFLVIWALGISMIVLSLLVHLPRKIILVFSCLLIFGHNLLDNIHFKDSFWWSMLHEPGGFKLTENFYLEIAYPLIPWIAVMSLGFCFGPLFDKGYSSVQRKKVLNIIGLSAILLFIVLRTFNLYGDTNDRIHYDKAVKSMMSFLNPDKYPPSLLYLLMTLGPSLVFLANAENLKGKIVDFFSTFGRVPFFYYILHIYLIHLLAMLFAACSGFSWHDMILHEWLTQPELKGYGFPLWVVYAVWLLVIGSLYPLCRKFDRYKLAHKEKWWLSYL